MVFTSALLVGSFLNVCIYRIPRQESVAYPPSHCPHCQQRLGPLELIPLISFLWQRGRCRHCAAAISWRYPLVELLTAILLTLVYLRFGWSLDLVYYGGLTALYIVIGFIDLSTMLIPTELVVGGMLWVTAYNLFTRQAISNWLLGGVLGCGLFYVIYVVSRGGLGGGDVRLASLLGLALGLERLPLALILACISGAAVAIFLLITRRANGKTPIPFAPFLAAAGYVAALWGEAIKLWYWSWLIS
ncbi:MAG: prepilin peptidase [Firmicutes bacterium]|nr:prepilin peptidase [Bacillota bacterium]